MEGLGAGWWQYSNLFFFVQALDEGLERRRQLNERNFFVFVIEEVHETKVLRCDPHEDSVTS